MKRAILAHFVLAVGLGLTSLLLSLLGNPGPRLPVALADELHVCPSGCSYSSIQAAVDTASDGDIIKVATGIYTGINTYGGLRQIAYISKTVTIQGGYTTTDWTTPYPITQPTTLDAQGQGRVLYITGDISPTIEGLRITGGNATGLAGGVGGHDAGGGVYIVAATATLSDDQLLSNTAYYGGGVYLYTSAATIGSNSVFSNSAVGGAGGGVFLDNSGLAILRDNVVTSNTATWTGGGIYLYFSDGALVTRNMVSGNRAVNWGGGGVYLENSSSTLSANTIISNTGGLFGGGVHLRDSDNVTLDANTILSNHAGSVGGGVFLWSSSASLTNTVMANNRADDWGGGLYLKSSDAMLTNTVIVDNQADDQAGGLYSEASSAHLWHTTLARNTGGDGSGVSVNSGSTVVMTNTILVSQTVGVTTTSGNAVIANGILWFGNGANTGGDGLIAATHEITGDPAFAPDGYHLTAASAAIDQGVDAGVTTDIDGDLRPAGAGFDLGADEFASTRYVATSGVDVGDCTNSAAPCRTVQYTVDVAGEGNIIKVATGVYTDINTYGGLRQIVYISKTVTLQGGYTTTNWTAPYPFTQPTTLDAQSQGRVLYIIGNIGPTIEGLYITGGDVTNGSFCPDYCGGGIMITDAAHPLILDVSIMDNRVGYLGGGLYADVGSPLTLSHVRFVRNEAYGYAGGGLFTMDDVTLDATDFISNVLDGYEGGAGAYVAGAAVVVGGQFEHNTARFAGGGGLRVVGATNMRDTRFIGNSASFGGGAVLAGTAVLTGGQFVDNVAIGRGGGLYAFQTLNLSGTQFISNEANGSGGGGVFAIGALTTTGALFKGNISTSNHGGGLYANSALLACDTQFVSNVAGWGGGGVYGNSVTTLLGGRVENNSAAASGGGLIIYGPTDVNGTQFISNTSGSAGGGLFVLNTLTLSGTSFFSNTAVGSGGGAGALGTTVVTHSQFVNNSGAFGGGMYEQDTLTLIDSEFINNAATIYGGGACTQGAATLVGGHFVNNRATGVDGFGGGLYAGGLTLISTEFMSNTAFDRGGGAYVVGGSALLNGGRFERNMALSGGGLRVDSTAFLTGTTFESNVAVHGGGVYLFGIGNGRIVNTLFDGNTVSMNGASLFLRSGGNIQLLHLTIASTSVISQQAIAVFSGTVGITDTIITNHGVAISLTSGSVYEDYNLFYNNGGNLIGLVASGGHSFVGDPAFIDPATGNYHLSLGSAAIDQGVDAGVATDIDGQVRPLGLAPDLGADEFASIRYVATSGVDMGDCTNSAAPCRTVQYAVDVADEGNIVKVATGVYTDVQARPWDDLGVGGVVTQVIYISRPLTIQGGYTISNWTVPYPVTQPTTLDAQGQGRVLYITRYATPLTASGLDITGGNATGLGGSATYPDAGGGVYADQVSVTLSNNRIFSNTAPSYGGGIFVRGGVLATSYTTLNNNHIFSNTASWHGGGLYVYGGFFGESYMILDNNTIMSNVANSASGAYIERSHTTWNNNRVVSNTDQAQSSTAVDISLSPATLNGNTIAYNRSSGLAWYGPDGMPGMFSNNLIHSNAGFGLSLAGYAIAKGNVISSNNGSGLSVYGNIIVEANTIISNTASPYVFGGGVQGGGTITLTANTIASNTAWVGGGAFLDTGITALYSNTFRANSANYGGGLAVYNTASLHGDLLISNTAIGGGGLVLNDGNVTLDRVKIISNTTSQYGGGIGLFSGQATIVNTVLTGNRANEFGSGLFIRHANARILHSTIAHNSEGDGVGIHVYSETISTVLVTNTILANHTAGITVTAGSTTTLNGVLWYGNGANTGGDGFITITHEITGDPAFAPDGYHLTAASAAIDQGVDAGVTTDVDGDLRPAGTGFDLGADEFPAALTVTKQASPNPVQAGSQLTYTLRVTNTGNVDLHAAITDVLPPYLDSGQTSGGTVLLPGQPYTWTAILSPGSVWTETIVANVRMGYSGTLINVVQVATAEGATGIYTATSQAQVTPMLKVTKQASSDVVQAGSQLTYTLRITNTGNVDLHATITDTLPAHVMPGGVLTWTPAITALGGVWSQTVVVTVELGYTGTLTNHVQVTTLEGITGETSSVVNVIGYRVYLPLALR